MKIIKYVFFSFMYFLSLAVLYSFKIQLFRHLDGEETGPELADSRFENARPIYISYYIIAILAMLLILFFSAKKIKTAPLISFGLLAIPVVYVIIDIFVIAIF